MTTITKYSGTASPSCQTSLPSQLYAAPLSCVSTLHLWDKPRNPRSHRGHNIWGEGNVCEPPTSHFRDTGNYNPGEKLSLRLDEVRCFHHLTKSKNAFDEQFLPAAVSCDSSRWIYSRDSPASWSHSWGIMEEPVPRTREHPDSFFPQVRERAGSGQLHSFSPLYCSPSAQQPKAQFHVLRFSLVTFSHQKLNLNPPACFLRGHKTG